MTDTSPQQATPALELSRVVKSFGAVVALRSGSIRLEKGSIHALIGENGAGKSTMVKIIAGLYRRDAGEFHLDGEPVEVKIARLSAEIREGFRKREELQATVIAALDSLVARDE